MRDAIFGGRSTQGGTRPGTGPGGLPTIIKFGDNICSQSPGFDTTGTTGGTGNYNVGNNLITDGSLDNWVEGAENIVDGSDNVVIGSSNSLSATINSNIHGDSNSLSNAKNINILGHGNQVSDKENVSIVGNNQLAFAENIHQFGTGLIGINKRTDLSDSDFLSRSGSLATFISPEIDLNITGVTDFQFFPDVYFINTQLVFVVTQDGGGGVVNSDFEISDGLGNIFYTGSIAVSLTLNQARNYTNIVNPLNTNLYRIEIKTATDSIGMKGRFIITGLISNI